MVIATITIVRKHPAKKTTLAIKILFRILTRKPLPHVPRSLVVPQFAQAVIPVAGSKTEDVQLHFLQGNFKSNLSLSRTNIQDTEALPRAKKNK